MELSAMPRLSSEETHQLNQFVRDYNLSINQGRQPQTSLGRDDFLKLLITQLSYQDPTSPVEDKEFIAQMAQFSTLEQMTAMASDFSRLTSMLMGNEATSSLGKGVEIVEGERIIQGIVQAVTKGGTPQVLVDGNFYDWEQVIKVFAEERSIEL